VVLTLPVQKVVGQKVLERVPNKLAPDGAQPVSRTTIPAEQLLVGVKSNQLIEFLE
jgi:hypothetical protein